MPQQEAVADDATSGRRGQFVEGAEREMLARYEESKWGVVDDVADEATPLDLRAVVCRKYIDRRLLYEEEELFHEFSPQAAQQVDFDELFTGVPAANRDQVVPDEFAEATLDFAIPESERVDDCSACGRSGVLRCPTCNTGGRVRCSNCRGSGVVTTFSGDEKACGSCGGSGSVICGTCDGNGRVICGTCDGEGQTLKINYLRRTYRPEIDERAGDEEVPDQYIVEAEGEYLTTTERALGENVIRDETEEREVPVAVLDYEYDGREYTLYQVEEEFKADSYPMSQTRRLLPFAAAAVVLLLLALYALGVV